MSQNNVILSHLRTRPNITPIEALNKYGCMRLAARIRDLRDGGNHIEMTLIPTNSGKWIGSYSLVKEAGQ